MSLQKIIGKLSALVRENDGLCFTLGIIDPTLPVEDVEQIPIHPLPRADNMMIPKGGESKYGQRSLAQLLLIDVRW